MARRKREPIVTINLRPITKTFRTVKGRVKLVQVKGRQFQAKASVPIGKVRRESKVFFTPRNGPEFARKFKRKRFKKAIGI